MKEKILKSDKSVTLTQEKLAYHYMNKYAKELQRHFNLSDRSLKRVFSKAASSVKTENSVRKFLNMIKLFK